MSLETLAMGGSDEQNTWVPMEELTRDRWPAEDAEDALVMARRDAAIQVFHGYSLIHARDTVPSRRGMSTESGLLVGPMLEGRPEPMMQALQEVATNLATASVAICMLSIAAAM